MRHELDGEIYYIGRTGDDEFVIFLPRIGRQDAAEYYAHRICHNLQTLSVGSHSKDTAHKNAGVEGETGCSMRR
ncbi:hypothetical protein [Veillonella magna]|uniref:hypothetical protein n=1 Tax=Veillonella magna TaxID=464322 RepID=UPI002666D8E8|nr:hypothetical protein [Veillonella magna]